MSSSKDHHDSDHILVNHYAIHLTLQEDAWGRPKAQPGFLSLWAWLPLTQSGTDDTLSHSLSYSTAIKEALRALDSRPPHLEPSAPWPSTAEAASHIASHVSRYFGGLRVCVEVEAENGALEAASLGTRVTWGGPRGDLLHPDSSSSFIRRLRTRTIIGIHPWERRQKQDVFLDLSLQPHLLPLTRITQRIASWTDSSGYRTVEALTSSLASLLLSTSDLDPPIQHLTLRVEKPRALPFAEGAGVQISRSRSSLSHPSNPSSTLPPPPVSPHPQGADVFIGMGANLGNDPAKNLSLALHSMSSYSSIHLLDTSFLYLTQPMYLTEQPKFFNAVCHIRTSLSPQDLLITLKNIESSMGRPSPHDPQSPSSTSTYIPNGPRPIDLDILIYQDLVLDSPSLTIPHPGIPEREFVLRPLCDLIPEARHPKSGKTWSHLLNDLCPTISSSTAVKVWPMGNGTVWKDGDPIRTMAILNCTPDSFSDGGSWSDLDAELQQAHSLIQAGAQCIDIGGMSTRPYSSTLPPSPEEEAARVIPVIRALSTAYPTSQVVLSIDTFRASVAEKAIQAGATWVNDVMAGRADPDILPLVRSHALPLCLMHSRGTPETMTSLTHYPASKGGVVGGMMLELSSRVHAAINAGIPRWLLWLDPGLGFAKTPSQNQILIRSMSKYTHPPKSSPLHGYPWLIAPSRKRFIGEVTSQPDPKNRDWGTAAVCVEAVRAGAQCVRVHRIQGLIDALRMAHSMYRMVDREEEEEEEEEEEGEEGKEKGKREEEKEKDEKATASA
ncbi:MAG: Dihydropteroate synthase-like protein [Piptocephalis tieghemiana]|nr:MAG: Dihydropteroate synthase-like protein [Piptocephalis tieghemiana]